MKQKKHKSGKGDVLTVTKDDFKGKKKFPIAPGGKYRFKFNQKSAIKPGTNGNILNLVLTLTAMHNGKKSEHKGVNVFDNIAPHVGWKIAQILRTIGIKKPPKHKMTLQELFALIKKFDEEFRVIIGTGRYNGKPKNTVIQYLPLEADKDEDDDDIEDDDDEDEDDDDEDSDEDSDDDDEDSDDDEDEDEDDDEDEDEDEDEDDDDEDDDDDDDDDEDDEDERPKRRGKAKTKKSKNGPSKKSKRRK